MGNDVVRVRGLPVPVLLLAMAALVAVPWARAAGALILNQRLPTLQSLSARAAPRPPAAAEMATTGPVCDIFANGYDEVGATPCAGCFDGTLDFTETDVDCGGGNCLTCALGMACAVNADCSSNACDAVSHACVSDQCSDHQQDGSETDVDCGGGTCTACAVGQTCFFNTDCSSNACDAVSHTCVSDQCSDNQQDGLETDVDCGGGCTACALGQGCYDDSDCSSDACDLISFTCVSDQCSDHQQDGSETGVDCGGGTCPTCADGQGCLSDYDCTNNYCDINTGTCGASGQCADGMQDGNETDVDCGGGTCPGCGLNQKCQMNSDCQEGLTCAGSPFKTCQ